MTTHLETRTKPAQPISPSSIWLMWVLVTPAGALAALFSMYLVIIVGKILIPGMNEDRFATYAFLPGLALFTTLGQVLVLKRMLDRPWGWLWASAAGWAVVLAVLFGWPKGVIPLDTANLMPLFSVLIGLALGAAQWLYLRRRFQGAGWWLPGSLAGWVVMGLGVGATFTSAWEVILFGLAPAFFSGAVLAWLASRSKA